MRSPSGMSNPWPTSRSTITIITVGATRKSDCVEAFNAFTATGRRAACSGELFLQQGTTSATQYACTTVLRTVQLRNELSTQAGVHACNRGFHTVDLDNPVGLADGDDFHIYVELSGGRTPL